MKTNSELSLIGYFSTIISWLFIIAGLVLFFVMSEEWLLKMYEEIVDTYQITILLSFAVFLPLSAIHNFRHFMGAGIILSRGVMVACFFLISLLILYINWGTIGVAIGLLSAGVGVFPLSFISSMVTKHWILLANEFFCLLGVIGCLIAESIFTEEDQTEVNTDNLIPLNIRRCTYAIWAEIPITLTLVYFIGGKDTLDWLGYFITICLTILWGHLIRRGYKIAFVLLILVYILRFQMILSHNNNLQIEGWALILNWLNYVLIVLAVYNIFMLFSPSSLKYFWGKKEPTISV